MTRGGDQPSTVPYEEWLRSTVQSCEDPIISKDLAGRIAIWNASAERVFGYTSREAIGSSILMIIPTDRIAEEREILDRLSRGELIPHLETVRRNKNGDLLEVSVTISPLRDAGGRLYGASKVVRDIRLQKQRERELYETRERYRILAEQITEGIFIADSNGRYVDLNSAAAQLLGYERSEILELGIADLLDPGELPRLSEQVERLAAGETLRNDWRFRRKDGSVFTGELIGRQLPDGRFQGVVRDVTQQREARKALERSHADLEQFAYSATHDLQEPIRTVSIFSELLQKQMGEKFDGRSREYLNHIRQAASRMQTLLKDILVFSQVTRFEKPSHRVDVASVTAKVITDLAGVIEATSAQITSDAMPSVPVHEAQLQQLFQNLLSNAIKYRKPDGIPRIHITATRQNGSWLFRVADNGIGIDGAYRDKIFELFHRLHSAEQYPGSGVGLALCQRIVEMYGGKIWVDSEPGGGATFCFTLPE